MKRSFIFTFMLVFGLFLAIPEQTRAEVNFKDVNRFESEITFLVENEIVRGFSDEIFAPDKTLTRAEAVLMISRTFDISSFIPEEENSFPDVHEDMKAYEAILFAKEYEIISGFEDGTFRPDETLTRGQMAQIMINAYDLKGSNGTTFSDIKNNRFEAAISTVAAHRITEGFEDGTYRPNNGMKRMEFAAFLARELNPSFKPAFTLKEKSAEELSTWAERTVEVDLYKDGEFIRYGTGFITESGLIATAYHVVAGGDEVYIYTADGYEYAIEGVVYSDMVNDLVLLKPEYKLPYPAIPMISSDKIVMGETIYSFGLPLGFPDFEQNEGNALTIHVVKNEDKTFKLFQYSSLVNVGSSGGPIVNKYGQAIGLNSIGSLEVHTMNFSPVLENLIPVHNEMLLKNWEEISIVDVNTLPLPPGLEDALVGGSE